MNVFVEIKKWEATWFNCYKISLGNSRSYKRRLKELEKQKSSNEIIGKKLALKALIEYPNL